MIDRIHHAQGNGPAVTPACGSRAAPGATSAQHGAVTGTEKRPGRMAGALVSSRGRSRAAPARPSVGTVVAKVNKKGGPAWASRFSYLPRDC